MNIPYFFGEIPFFISLVIGLIFLIIELYISILLIKALNLFIKNNSNKNEKSITIKENNDNSNNI